MEETVILIKPDGVKRGLVGQILSRFEQVGLKIVAMKMVWVSEAFVGKHYRDDPDWYRSVGERLLKFYEENGRDPGEDLGTRDPVKLGKKVREWLFTYITSGPIIAMLLEAPHAVELARKLVGHTYPLSAAPGTIRGDYHYDSPFLSNFGGRSVQNLIHASGSSEEVEFEKKLWFHKKEIHNYRRVGEE